MKSKLAFAAGMAAGYVIGARAGRPGYEAIKRTVRSFWAQNSVQDTLSTVQDSVAAQAGEVVHKVVDQVLPSKKTGKVQPASQSTMSPATTTEEDFEDRSLHGSGRNPLDIVPEASDEFPDEGNDYHNGARHLN